VRPSSIASVDLLNLGISWVPTPAAVAAADKHERSSRPQPSATAAGGDDALLIGSLTLAFEGAAMAAAAVTAAAVATEADKEPAIESLRCGPEHFDIGGGELAREDSELNRMFSFQASKKEVPLIPFISEAMLQEQVTRHPDPFAFIGEHIGLA